MITISSRGPPNLSQQTIREIITESVLGFSFKAKEKYVAYIYTAMFVGMTL